MIEMLGVLAIVGVLSIGGIAGYSKAMLMYKSNRQMEQINRLFHTMILLGFSLGQSESKGTINLIPVLKAMNEIPEEMLKNSNERYVYDAFGNQIDISFVNDMGLIAYNSIMYYLYGTDESIESCHNILKFAKLNFAFIWRVGARNDGDAYIDSPKQIRWEGDSYCIKDNKPCLKDMTPVDMSNMCNLCGDEPCYFSLTWNYTPL